ncbi:OmpA/MotB family protein [Azospirillum lipoferum]|uniref:OmpA-like domain-containing protein n=1 Tax=Azospirillum lipoferum (strain 4B) TaxID=862719 RepID=G7Z9C0_AZOL4|nr:OmpA family protein [Azospirillum lipoferum]CBS86074.1 Protein of unknown function [Azospirillum lipoferum 4B]
MQAIRSKRGRRHSAGEAGEQDGYFASVSDLLTGILFIFILLLTGVVIDNQGADGDMLRVRNALEAERGRAEHLAHELSEAQKEARTIAKRLVDERDEARREAHSAQSRLTSLDAQLSAARNDIDAARSAETTARRALSEMQDARTTEQILYTKNKQKRAELLNRIVNTMREQRFEVVAELEEGVLRLPDGLLFEKGDAKLDRRGAQALQVLAGIMEREVHCATRPSQDCPPGSSAFLEAVFIEGHSDNTQVRPGQHHPDFANNWRLSTRRALEAFSEMMKGRPNLEKLANAQGRSVFGVSGYAGGRAIADNSTEQGQEQNRRIDMRFLLSGTAPLEKAPTR